MSFKSGFITPPWPHTPGDSVSAESVIQRIEKNAHRGCGLHYEIYEYRALSELNDVLASLSPGDAEIFRNAAAQRGFHLNEKELQESYQAYCDTLNEIRKDEI